MTDKKTVWFPAKDNGWGWGKPNTWQGWLVLVLYIVSVAIVSFAVDPKEALLKWAVLVASMTFVLLLVYLWKGEAPNWKWKPIEKDKRRWYK